MNAPSPLPARLWPYVLALAVQMGVAVYAFHHLDVTLWDDTGLYMAPALAWSWKQLHLMRTGFSPAYLIFLKLEHLIVRDPLLLFYANHALLALLSTWGLQYLAASLGARPWAQGWLGLCLSLSSFLGLTVPHVNLFALLPLLWLSILAARGTPFSLWHVLAAQLLWLSRPEFGPVFWAAAGLYGYRLLRRRPTYVGPSPWLAGALVLVLVASYQLPFLRSDSSRLQTVLEQNLFYAAAQLGWPSHQPQLSGCGALFACLRPYLADLPYHFLANVILFAEGIGAQFLSICLPVEPLTGNRVLAAVLGWLLLSAAALPLRRYITAWHMPNAAGFLLALSLILCVGVCLLINPRMHYMQLLTPGYTVLFTSLATQAESATHRLPRRQVILAAILIVGLPALTTGSFLRLQPDWRLATVSRYQPDPPIRALIGYLRIHNPGTRQPWQVLGGDLSGLRLYLPPGVPFIHLPDALPQGLTPYRSRLVIYLEPQSRAELSTTLRIPPSQVEAYLTQQGWVERTPFCWVNDGR